METAIVLEITCYFCDVKWKYLNWNGILDTVALVELPLVVAEAVKNDAYYQYILFIPHFFVIFSTRERYFLRYFTCCCWAAAAAAC